MISDSNDNKIIETVIEEQGKWGECFASFDLNNKMPVSHEQIKNSIKKCYKNVVNVNLKRGNIAEVTYKRGTETITIAFRTFRQTDRAELPFYSMSSNKLSALEKNGIKRVLLLFWEKQESGNSAPFYYDEMCLDYVKSSWDCNEEKTLYRINATKKEGGYYLKKDQAMTKSQTGVIMATQCGGIE